jgi:cell wall-associated NlpC family hydrolase
MFASGNQSGGVGELLGGSAHLTDTIVKDQLGSLALTNGQQLTNDLASKLGDLHSARDRLARQKEAKAKLLATLQSRQAAAEQKQKQLLALQNTTNTALKQALADEQVRREAAAARSRAEAVKARRTKRGGGGQSSSGAAANAGGGNSAGAGAGSNDNSNDNTGSSSGGSAGGGSGGGASGGTSGGGGSSGGGSSGGGSSGGGSGNGRPGHRVPPPSPGASGAVAAALSQVGVPYISFMSQPGVGFDCSGLTMWAWSRAGVGLPHYSKAQFEQIQHVDPSDAQPGDLLFFYHPISHVGMYIGGGQMVDASHPGKPISVHGFGWSQVVGVGRPG